MGEAPGHRRSGCATLSELVFTCAAFFIPWWTKLPCPFPSARRAFGQLRKKHGEAFPVRSDVLASLQFVVARIVPSFAVQVR